MTDMNSAKSNLPITTEPSTLHESIKTTNSSADQLRSKTNYMKLNLTTLEDRFGFINWRFLFNLMQLNSEQAKIDELLLENTDYLQQIELLFKRHDLITIDNYLCWATTARFLPYLGLNFRRTFSEFKRKVPEPPSASASDLPQMETNLFNNLNYLKNDDDYFKYHLLDKYKRRKNSPSATGRLYLSRWKECKCVMHFLIIAFFKFTKLVFLLFGCV